MNNKKIVPQAQPQKQLPQPSSQSSISFTTVPVTYERQIPLTYDINSFYPPLKTESSNSILNLNSSILKKQEQEIKSQLSPSFWDRLNEATKRVNQTDAYDYNYTTYTSLNSVNKTNQLENSNNNKIKIYNYNNNQPIQTQINLKNNYEEQQRQQIIKAQEYAKSLLNNLNQTNRTISYLESYNNRLKQELNTNNAANAKSFEKSQTFTNKSSNNNNNNNNNDNTVLVISTSNSQPKADDNIQPFIIRGRRSPSQNNQQLPLENIQQPTIIKPLIQTATSPSTRSMSVIFKPQVNHITNNNNNSSVKATNNNNNNNNNNSNNNENNSISNTMINPEINPDNKLGVSGLSAFTRKIPSTSSGTVSITENLLSSPSNASSVSLSSKHEPFSRSKTITLAERDKYLSILGLNNNSSSGKNQSDEIKIVNLRKSGTSSSITSNSNQKTANIISNNGIRNFHKSLSIRSNVNNFYKDFVDDRNGYLSILKRTDSDINLKSNINNNSSNNIEKLLMTSGNVTNNENSFTPPPTPTENNESKTPDPINLILLNNICNDNSNNSNLVESKSDINLIANLNGVSFATGESGYFPSKNVDRSAETDTWKVHKSHLLVGNVANSSSNKLAQSQIQSLTQSNSQLQHQLSQQSLVEKRSSYLSSDSRTNINSFYYSENPQMQKKFQANPHRSMQSQGALRFFFARHGERIDLSFGPQWIEASFDRSGKYRRTNLNMPNDLPFRPSKRDFLGDSPLTEIGQFQARLTGEALGNEGYKLHYCYTSPALRCIQTAHQILSAQGLEKIVKIRIEPSVFEFLGWYDKGLPTFINTDSLVQFGFNIDVNYRPLLPLDRLQPDENYSDYYQRSFNLTKYLTNLHQSEGANILVVGHAGTLEVCTRQICGLPIRPYTEFNATIRKVSYLGLAMLEKEANNSTFEIQSAVIPALGHTANFNFDPMSLKI